MSDIWYPAGYPLSCPIHIDLVSIDRYKKKVGMDRISDQILNLVYGRISCIRPIIEDFITAYLESLLFTEGVGSSLSGYSVSGRIADIESIILYLQYKKSPP